MSHNVGSGSNRVIFVIIALWDPTAFSVVGVTYAGTSLTRIGQSDLSPTNSDRVEIWRLINPTSGNNTVSIDCPSACSDSDGYALVISCDGADQTDPDGTVATATGDSTTPSVTVSSATDRWVIDGVASDSASSVSLTMTADTDRTQRLNAVDSGERTGGSEDQSSAASEVMDWSLGSSAPLGYGWGIHYSSSDCNYNYSQRLYSRRTYTRCIYTIN